MTAGTVTQGPESLTVDFFSVCTQLQLKTLNRRERQWRTDLRASGERRGAGGIGKQLKGGLSHISESGPAWGAAVQPRESVRYAAALDWREGTLGGTLGSLWLIHADVGNPAQ